MRSKSALRQSISYWRRKEGRLMASSLRLLVLVVLAQLALPVCKASGLALASTSWLLATCLFWGPWLMLLVVWLLGLLLRDAFREPPIAEPVEQP